jgi:hypothetical protein
MRKKLWIAIVVLAVVLTTVGIAVSADDGDDHKGRTRRVNWRIAGSVFNGIQVIPGPGEPSASFALINLSAKGSPGKAQIEYVGTAQPIAGDTGLCPEGTVMQLAATSGFVATFPDQSMLFFAIDDSPDAKNVLCITPPGPNTGVWDYDVTGGAGRFEGATGHVTVRGTAWAVSPALAAEAGEIVGTIKLP